jgi:hypothetical protein
MDFATGQSVNAGCELILFDLAFSNATIGNWADGRRTMCRPDARTTTSG